MAIYWGQESFACQELAGATNQHALDVPELGEDPTAALRPCSPLLTALAGQSGPDMISFLLERGFSARSLTPLFKYGHWTSYAPGVVDTSMPIWALFIPFLFIPNVNGWSFTPAQYSQRFAKLERLLSIVGHRQLPVLVLSDIEIRDDTRSYLRRPPSAPTTGYTTIEHLVLV